MTEKQQQSTEKYTPTLATELINGDIIAVTLVAQEPGGNRLSVSATFNHLGEAIDAASKQSLPGVPGLDLGLLSGTAAPEFPMAKYQELVNTGQVEAAEDLKTAHEMAVEAWEQEGNQSLPDAIGTATLSWAEKVHNVHTTDGNWPVIKPDQVVVRNVVRNTPSESAVFVVQLTPVWG